MIKISQLLVFAEGNLPITRNQGVISAICIVIFYILLNIYNRHTFSDKVKKLENKVDNQNFRLNQVSEAFLKQSGYLKKEDGNTTKPSDE